MLEEKRHTGKASNSIPILQKDSFISIYQAYPIETCYPQSVLSSEKHTNFFVFQSY